MAARPEIAPERGTAVLGGRRYQLKAPIDFTPLEWLEFNRDYELFALAVEPAEVSERLYILMPRIFVYGEPAPRRRRWPPWKTPAPDVGPDAQAILGAPFGERLQALRDFMQASSGTGLGATSRPTTATPESPPSR